MFEIAALQDTLVEFELSNGSIDIIKDGLRRTITYEQFDDLFYVVNDVFDAALKTDCVFYKVINGSILLKNRRNEERNISMNTFLKLYSI